MEDKQRKMNKIAAVLGKNRKKIVVAASITMIVVSLAASWMFYREQTDKDIEIIQENVVVHTQGWIKNTNSFPIIIKCVESINDERTQWISVLQPGQRIETKIKRYDKFYILTMGGVEIGFIDPYTDPYFLK